MARVSARQVRRSAGVLVPAAIRALTLAASTGEERGALDDRALDEVRTSADLRRERGADLLEELALSGPAIDPDDAAALRAAL